MAQFKKNLFGSSFFGYTTTLDGYYTTPVVDADEPFDGTVDISIKATTPSCRYYGNNDEWVPLPDINSAEVHGDEISTTVKNSSLSYFLCADIITIAFNNVKNKGKVKVQCISPIDDSIVLEEEVNTTNTKEKKIEVPFQIYQLNIVQIEDTPATIKYIDVRTSVIGAEVKTSVDEINWTDLEDVKLRYDEKDQVWKGSSSEKVGQQFVRARIHLGTSDMDVTPIIDNIMLSSGDMNVRTEDGWWMGAIDFNAAAEDEKVSFSKAKRIEWKEDCPEPSYSEVRSTSSLNTMPNKMQVKDSTYWKQETARYTMNRQDHPEEDWGVPYDRISLIPKSNLADVIGPSLTPLFYKLKYVKNLEWLSWNDQTLYPLESVGTNVVYEFYTAADDIENGIPAVFRIENPIKSTDRVISLQQEYKNYPFYVRVLISRTSGLQTPVVDYFDMYASMRFDSPHDINNENVPISAIDNFNGEEEHKTIKTEQYPWPTNNQPLPENASLLKGSTRTMTINYNPNFPGQIEFFYETERIKENPTVLTAIATEKVESPVISKVIADEPVASTREVSGDRLVFHYSYDGGLVQFPHTVDRDMPVDYTPDLLSGRLYKYEVSQGWPDEWFTLPYSMEWEEVAEILGYEVEVLQAINKNVKLYNGKIPQGMQIFMPNDSNDLDLTIKFESTQNRITEKSIWNGTNNEKIEATIPVEPEQEPQDWTSEEKTYTGYMNPNNQKSAYLRNQKIKNLNHPEMTYTIKEQDTYRSVAKNKNVNILDLQKANNDKELKAGEELIIPASFNLPSISDSVFLDKNPYHVEIVPYTVKKKDGTVLSDNAITLGSDDEPVLQTTMVESEPVTVTLKRGARANKSDPIPYTNVNQILSVQNIKTGYNYQPYVNNGDSEVGDYVLFQNQVSWSPRHANAKEPEAGEEYSVVFTYQIVDTVRIVMTSDYSEQAESDRLWRSEDVKEYEATVSPGRDRYIQLPVPESFSGFDNQLKETQYIVEDNDLWVKTTIEEKDGKHYLKATMNEDNPKRNWYPEINTGNYYLGSQEYHLYSEPIETTYDTADVPIINNTREGENGVLAQKDITNYFLNSTASISEDEENVITYIP